MPTAQELEKQIKQLSADIQLLRQFVHGEDTATVTLGENEDLEATPSLRNLARQIRTGLAGTVFKEYEIEVPGSGTVMVNLAALGHPTSPVNPANPTLNILSTAPYFCCITHKNASGFTVQVYGADGSPGVVGGTVKLIVGLPL